MNYESEIEEILLNELKKKYGIENNWYLLVYLKIRYFLLYPKQQKEYKQKHEVSYIEKKSYMNFLLNELYISELLYKDYPLTYTYQENSLLSIFENLEYFLSSKKIQNSSGTKQEVYSYIFEMIEDLKQKTLKYSKKEETLFHQLSKLNQLFQTKEDTNVNSIEGFIQNQLDEQISEELKLKRYIDFSNFESTKAKDIEEETLQEYMIRNLNEIEDELKYIGKEYQIEDGRIDILAEDKNKNIVIIELKVNDDERLPWQCLYYPKEIQKLYPKRNLRMLTIAPHYKKSILTVLKDLNVEIYQCFFKSTNHKITELSISKIDKKNI